MTAPVDRWEFRRESDGEWTTITITLKREPSPTLHVHYDEARYSASCWVLAAASGVLMGAGATELGLAVQAAAEQFIRRGEES